MDGSDANGTNNRRLRASAFDPVAGMRAMADIQAEGLRAASEILERVLEPPHDGPRAPDGTPERDYSALVDAWAELLQRVAAGLARPAESSAVTVPVEAGAVTAPLRLVVNEEEPRAEAEVWLHNGTATAVGPLSLRCGPLTGPDGALLEDVAMHFDPTEVALLPERSSRAVLVAIEVAGAPQPGAYRGAIQADGASSLWLPVEVEVELC